MSLFSVLDISGSGMNAQSVRLNTVSSNLANADAVSSSIDETYRARMPVFRAVMDEMTGKAESSQV
ncbi:MAG: flagellar basal body rod protein FlgC, partial [Anaerolineae bacterium]|nr:flagellar basal body rod protein FlgC [Anaerolineae bacterium]